MDQPPVCDECEDAVALLKCFECDLCYCEPCAQVFHKKGTRASHKLSRLPEVKIGGGGEEEVEEEEPGGAKDNDADDSDEENTLPTLARRKSGGT